MCRTFKKVPGKRSFSLGSDKAKSRREEGRKEHEILT